MSYDLYFYKPKSSSITEDNIASYLTNNLVAKSLHGNEWAFENNETGVYFFFAQNAPETDAGSIELYESFISFDNMHFSFNLNFMRPSFFGLEAFLFVEKLINDLNLFVLDPQSPFEEPYKATKEELYERWNKTNLWSCSDHFDKLASYYLAVEKCNNVWEYNFNRKRMQNNLGDRYFVPKIFFCKTVAGKHAFTLSTWTEHIPSVIPNADYFALHKNYSRLFKKVKRSILVTRETLLKHFEPYFDEFNFKDCKIIHPFNARRVADIFNALKADEIFDQFGEGLPLENLYNAKP